MDISSKVQAIGKGKNSWKNKDGQIVESLYGNFSQNNGALVDTLRFTPAQFETWQTGATYIVRATLAKSRSNGLYLQILDIMPEQQGK